MTTVIFIMGPTASGKTDLAIELSKLIPSELISVDSALVYRGLDIGSAKPDAETLAAYPHRLVDVRDPADAYSAAEFVEDAQRAIDEIHALGKVPILVGGTTLYFKALLEGLEGLPPANQAIRDDLEARAEKLGWPALHAELAKIDPETAARLHPNHNQRIQRALEVYQLTGKTMTEIHGAQIRRGGSPNGFLEKYDVRQLAIMPSERKTLHQRIEQRLNLMFEHGFIDEVERLYKRGDLHPDLPSIRAVGYRQLWNYFEQGEFAVDGSFVMGSADLEEAKFRALVATRNLAKRQLTWLRSWPDLPILYTDCHKTKPDMKVIVSAALNLLNLEQYKQDSVNKSRSDH